MLCLGLDLWDYFTLRKASGVLGELLNGEEICILNFKGASIKHKKGYVYRNRATSREQGNFEVLKLKLCLGQSLGLKLSLGLLVVLGSVNTVLYPQVSIISIKVFQHDLSKAVVEETDLVVVGEVGPRHNVDKQLGVAGVTGSDTLQVVGHLRNAVEGLALLDLVDHLAHIHLNLSLVLGESVETVYNR